jgi:cellulose biosynthesis protein BcsQ
MRAIAVYNMKGGVGKSTTAVNLSHLAASTGERVLLWDLDPQAASSFAFRIRPHVSGFGRACLENGEALGAAIKETDYANLDLLPADFAYRKLDRLLGDLRKPGRAVARLLETLGHDYDVVFLDCPAGLSLLTEGVLAAADTVLVPTIPNVLSLRTLARVIKSADRADSSSDIAAFLNMVDRRKALHRQVAVWSADRPTLFLSGQVPCASAVEQVAIRRTPLAVFAAQDAATAAFRLIWAELCQRLYTRPRPRVRRHAWAGMLQEIESLIAQLETAYGGEPYQRREVAQSGEDDACVIHRFDTESADLERSGYLLELREQTGSVQVTMERSGGVTAVETNRVQARIDSAWALEILSGRMSPLEALERRLGSPGPPILESARAVVCERALRRIDSYMPGDAAVDARKSRQPAGAMPRSAIQHDRVIPFQASTPPRRQTAGG